ncbi:hypothetical protein [Rhizobium sp. Rhizsp42]|uniref:hypothetical protein n=1 Tax=Rhizobium sp. Rhizsp42 TaxID=3243034 RepID=UPI0039AEB257
MANSFPTGAQHDETDEDSAEQSNNGAGNLETANSSDLPPAIRAIQELFRPRFEAQDRRMEALAAAHFAARLENAKVTHDLPADEALNLLEGVMDGEIEWPV